MSTSGIPPAYLRRSLTPPPSKAPPTPSPPRPSCLSIHDGNTVGVIVEGRGTKGRLEGCKIYRNARNGVEAWKGSDPSIFGCSIYDHAGGGPGEDDGVGILVRSDAAGGTTAADCRFGRNAGGDYVREAPLPPELFDEEAEGGEEGDEFEYDSDYCSSDESF